MPHNVTRDSPDALPEDLQAIGARYRTAARAEKSRILDEVVRRTGYHRKHAVRLLRRKRAPLPLYDASVGEALVYVWRASGRACGKRLKALMPELLEAMERDGRLPRDPLLRTRLLRMSAATIDRRLAPARRKPTVDEAVRNLEAIQAALVELAQFSIPADLPPEERERLEGLRRQCLDHAGQAIVPSWPKGSGGG